MSLRFREVARAFANSSSSGDLVKEVPSGYQRRGRAGFHRGLSAHRVRLRWKDRLGGGDRPLVNCQMEVSPGRAVLALILDVLWGRSPLFRVEDFFADKDVESNENGRKTPRPLRFRSDRPLCGSYAQKRQAGCLSHQSKKELASESHSRLCVSVSKCSLECALASDAARYHPISSIRSCAVSVTKTSSRLGVMT
jgi:hypothetical protein